MRGTRWELECGRRIAALFVEGRLGDRPDALLVERFARDRSEHAFATLVDRHGPRVLRVCRAVAGDPHAADDAFQATFLVLARKAGRLRVGDSLGPWLHGVAIRVASTARTVELRRKRREGIAAGMRPVDVADRVDDPDLARLLHLEIARLPAPLCEAVMLCDVEGLSHAEAAERLGRPVGTVKSRVSRGRTKLRARLIRRGIEPAAVLAASFGVAEATVPEALRAAATRGVLSIFAGGAVRPAIRVLLTGVNTTMMTKAKLMLSGLVLGVGAIGVYAQTVPGETPRATPADPPAAQPGGRPGAAPAATRPEVTDVDPFLFIGESPDDRNPKPPSDDEVWQALRRGQAGKSQVNIQRSWETAEPPRFQPSGVFGCLIHKHYEFHLDLNAGSTTGSHHREVVYIDKDFIRTVAPSREVPAATAAEAAAPTVLTTVRSEAFRGMGTTLDRSASRDNRPSTDPPTGAPRVDTEQRLAEVEKKLDLILKALENQGKTPFRTQGGLGP